jgi:hypothetical protein
VTIPFAIEEAFKFTTGTVKDQVGFMDLTFKGFVLTVAKGIDILAKAFLGLFGGLSEVVFQVSLTLFNPLRKAVNALLEFTTERVNELIGVLNKIPGVDLLESLFNPLEIIEAGTDIGSAFSIGFQDGIKGEVGLESTIRQFFDDAKKRAEERAKKLAGSIELTNTGDDVREGAPVSIADPKILETLDRENQLLRENDLANRKILEISFDLIDKKEQLSQANLVLLDSLLKENRALTVQDELFRSIVGPAEDATFALEQLLEIQDQLSDDQFIQAQRKLKIALLETSTSFGDGVKRGLLKVEQDLTDFASFAEDAVTRAFQGGENAIVEFAKTGELAFGTFIENILLDLLRLIVRLKITIPLAKSLSAALSNDSSSSSGGGIGSAIGNILGGLFNTDAATNTSNISQSTTGPLGPGFATGGSFMVGGSGGTDSQNVRFRASPNEEVTIRTPAQQRANGGNRTVVNIIDKSSKSETKQSSSTAPNGDFEIEVMIVDIVANDINGGGKIANNIGEFFGSSAQPLSRG